MGVFAPLTGIVGCTQAAEALKLAAGIGESLTGRLLLLDRSEHELAGSALQSATPTARSALAKPLQKPALLAVDRV